MVDDVRGQSERIVVVEDVESTRLVTTHCMRLSKGKQRTVVPDAVFVDSSKLSTGPQPHAVNSRCVLLYPPGNQAKRPSDVLACSVQIQS